MFERHAFDPDTDLKRNTWGVLEWAGNKREREREWDLYLRARQEDLNAVCPAAKVEKSSSGLHLDQRPRVGW